jgi:pheromone shutdown protein TraB
MELVTQQDGMRVESFRAKILNADIDGAAFDERWSSLPISLRVQLSILVPIFVVYLLLFGTRETLAENIALDDLPSSEEILSDDEDFEPLDSLIIDERDRILIEHVTKLESQQEEAKQIGIVYGARHMRSTMKFLMQKLNYRIAKSEWVTVFDL